MAKMSILLRLVVAGGMIVLLLLCLAYWWLGNLPHETAGTAMFALLVRHLYVSRRWFTTLFCGRYDLRRSIVLVLNVMLMVNMALLLTTSVAISQFVFRFLHISGNVMLREIHWFSAYWLMVIVGVHLGLHWTRVMALVRSGLGMVFVKPGRTALLRIGAILVAVSGLWSFSLLKVWTKLTFRLSLDFWNFSVSVAPFFYHWAAVVGLFGIASHYMMLLLRSLSRSDR